MFDRRTFLQNAAKTATITAATTSLHPLFAQSAAPAPRSPNDTIQFALIGAGIQGQGDTRNAVQVPGVKLVAVADCYDGRLAHTKELWGSDLFTTRDYREILARKDVDAVIIATPDHWHKQAAVDAMHAGKDVYLEKPMIHLYSDGPEIIEAARSTNRILQVGSQRVSSIVYAKAKELLASGAIGKLNMVTARWDRNSSIGAWNYTVPLDASTDHLRLAALPRHRPQDPLQRRTLLPMAQMEGLRHPVSPATSSSISSAALTSSPAQTAPPAPWPPAASASGRTAATSTTFSSHSSTIPKASTSASASTSSTAAKRAKASSSPAPKALMEIAGQTVTVTRTPLATEPGYTISTFTDAMQKQYVEQYRKKYPIKHPEGPPAQLVEKFVAPPGYSDSYDHFHNFFNSVRTRKPVVEDATFGFRAAGAALLSNLSVERGDIVHWNPETMKLA